VWEFPPFSTEDGTFYPTMLWGNFLNAVVLYVNALLLYPYRKRLRIPYWLAALLLIFGTAILETLVDYQLVFYLDLGDKLDTLFEGQGHFYIVAYFIRNFITHLLWYILSFTIVFVYESKKNRQIHKDLKEAKLKAIAKSTLLKFSDLLRYQLYECQDEWISLAKELAHIRAYIDMEKIRRGRDVTIQLSLPETVESYMISPLLFTPFLENAFKYVSNEDDGTQNKIDISIRLKEGQLFFEIENTIDKNNTLQQGGIGIENVKKRLALLYAQKHHLDIFEKENRFIVRMNISLK